MLERRDGCSRRIIPEYHRVRFTWAAVRRYYTFAASPSGRECPGRERVDNDLFPSHPTTPLAYIYTPLCVSLLFLLLLRRNALSYPATAPQMAPPHSIHHSSLQQILAPLFLLVARGLGGGGREQTEQPSSVLFRPEHKAQWHRGRGWTSPLPHTAASSFPRSALLQIFMGRRKGVLFF